MGKRCEQAHFIICTTNGQQTHTHKCSKSLAIGAWKQKPQWGITLLQLKNDYHAKNLKITNAGEDIRLAW